MYEDLSPVESVVDGERGGEPAAAHIAWLTADRLARAAVNASGWSTLYRDPRDGRFWELTYPESHRHGGGPPRLAVVTPEVARATYGDGAVTPNGDADSDDTPPLTCRVVPLEVRFIGPGALVRDGGAIHGGVAEPALGADLTFAMWREVPDAEGQLNPVLGEDTVAGAFQLSLEGSAAGFRELARYLLGVAELDTKADPGFHEHHEAASADGRTRLHIIVRRAEVRADVSAGAG